MLADSGEPKPEAVDCHVRVVVVDLRVSLFPMDSMAAKLSRSRTKKAMHGISFISASISRFGFNKHLTWEGWGELQGAIAMSRQQLRTKSMRQS